MKSTIYKYEKDFLLKFEKLVSLLADVNYNNTNNYYVMSVDKYSVGIDSIFVKVNLILWLENILKQKDYSNEEISIFFKNDLSTILENGYQLSFNQYKKDDISLMTILFAIISIVGILVLPIYISEYYSDKKYYELTSSIRRELENAKKQEDYFKIFDYYLKMI